MLLKQLKLKKLLAVKRPSNVTELRSSLGMSGFYRKFINDYSREIVPLCELLKKKAKFDWTENCESAFQYLKEQLENPQLLSFPDFSRPFILQTDASDFAEGYMLAQEENNELFPARFGGCVLSPAECRYSPTERELLAIFYSVKQEEIYLKGHDFVVYSDHEPLTHLSTTRELINKRYRWIEYLEEIGTIIRYLPGKENPVADYISRNLKRESKLNVLRCCSLHLSEHILNNNDIAADQLNDKNLKVVIAFLQNKHGVSRQDVPPIYQRYLDKLKMKDHLLVYKRNITSFCVVAPENIHILAVIDWFTKYLQLSPAY